MRVLGTLSTARLFTPAVSLGLTTVLLFLAAPAISAHATENPVQWSLTVKNSRVKRGGRIVALVTARIAPGWHVYSITQPPGGPVATVITVPDDPAFSLAAPITGPKPDKEFDPNFRMETETYEDSAVFKLPLLVKSDAPPNSTLHVGVYFQTCDAHQCLPPARLSLSASVHVLSAAASISKGSAPPPSQPAVEKTISPSVATQGSTPSFGSGSPASESSSPKATIFPNAPQRQPFRSFLWLAAVMGALSLLTPCVFPMIPITVSYFTNHVGTNRKSAVATALVYGIGIILTFTALGLLLAVLFGAGGVNQLATNPWINLLITAIFLGFAFSLFGAYFIQAPSWLIGKFDSITRSKEGSSIVGALLMGVTFTLTSFTCTAPFVGTLLVMTTQGNWRWPLAGMLAFSTVFAVPFFLLALAPQLLSRLPKAGGWMAQIKVAMGFLEIAAAMKFLSNADLVWRWGIFTRQVVLAVWIGVGVLTVLYILGYFRMEHDTPVESVGPVRVAIAIIFLATTIWLIPGLFGRTLGELESFLPPEIGTSSSSTTIANSPKEPDWILNNYESALETAKQQNKLVFVDFTGYTCTNCRWMEANMFPRPEVANEMEKFVRVRLYTDGDGDLYARQQKMQQEKFGTVALPLYAILRSDGTTVSTFPGLTRNSAEFVSFLQKALQSTGRG